MRKCLATLAPSGASHAVIEPSQSVGPITLKTMSSMIRSARQFGAPPPDGYWGTCDNGIVYDRMITGLAAQILHQEPVLRARGASPFRTQHGAWMIRR